MIRHWAGNELAVTYRVEQRTRIPPHDHVRLYAKSVTARRRRWAVISPRSAWCSCRLGCAGSDRRHDGVWGDHPADGRVHHLRRLADLSRGALQATRTCAHLRPVTTWLVACPLSAVSFQTAPGSQCVPSGVCVDVAPAPTTHDRRDPGTGTHLSAAAPGAARGSTRAGGPVHRGRRTAQGPRHVR